MTLSAHSASFQALVRAHHAAVYRTAWRVLRSEPDAQDVTQQVFLWALPRADELCAGEDPGRALRATAVRTALGERRARASRRRREERYAMAHAEQEGETRADELERAEVSQALGRALAGLALELRAALVLRFQEGLTYREVAQLCACSEPSAYDRVRRGLERLRARLGSAGFAGVLAVLGGFDLEGALALEPAAPVPSQLEPSLLALEHGALLAAVAATPVLPSALIAGLVALGVLGALGVGFGLRGDAREGSARDAELPARVAVGASAAGARLASSPASARAELEPQPVTPLDASAASAPRERALISGRVVDQDGRAVAEALVRAASREHSSKQPVYLGAATSERDGSFRLELDVARADGQPLELHVHHAAYAAARTPPVSVRPGERVDAGDVRILAGDADVEGRYRLAVLVRDAFGVPVAGASVALFRRLAFADGSRSERREADARTDARGRAVLAGDRLGEKRLVVDARAQGLRAFESVLALAWSGEHEEQVELEPALAIAGRVVASSGALPPGLMVDVFGAPGLYDSAALDAQGRFRFGGLDPGRHTLRLGGGAWAQLELGVEAGSEQLELVLERLPVALPTDGLHGRLVDAASGAPVFVGPLCVEAEVLPADADDGELARDVYPNLLVARSRQVAFFDGPPPPTDELHIDGLPAGRYCVVARTSGFAPCFAGPFELAAGARVLDLELRLQRGGSATGVVRAPSGKPLAGALVVVAGSGARSRERIAELDRVVRETRGQGHVEGGPARCDGRGRFALEHLPSDLELVLVALHADHEPVASAPLRVPEGGEAVPVVLRFERAR